MPDYEAEFITAEKLLELLNLASEKGCLDPNGAPQITLLDLRNENFLKSSKTPLAIKTHCRTVLCLLDDLRKPDVRAGIPHDGLVVSVTETGNRDVFAISYLSQFGYTNIKGLLFGMRGWLKADYPTQPSDNVSSK